MGCGSSRRSSVPESIIVEKEVKHLPIVVPPSPSTQSVSPVQAVPKFRSPKLPAKIVEDYVIVYLDQSIGDDSEATETQLQQVASAVIVYTDPEKCLAFIEDTKDENVFLVISGMPKEDFVSTAQDIPSLDSMYILHPKKAKLDNWTSNYPLVHGPFQSAGELFEKLQENIKSCTHNSVQFEVLKADEASFMYDQLFREMVLTLNEDDIEDILKLFRSHYASNEKETEFFNKLEKNYKDLTPIWWYTIESCLYKVLNKALRTHEYDTLYKLRVFIRHLDEQLIKLWKDMKIQTMKVYRGQGLQKADFDRICENKGDLISFPSFLSTTGDPGVALGFALRSKLKIDEPASDAVKNKMKIGVLMEIIADKDNSVPFAHVKKLSAIKDEDEWLFSMGSIFRVDSITEQPNGIWRISLTSTNHCEKQLETLKECLQKSLRHNNVYLNFARLMYQLALWERSKVLYETILEDKGLTWDLRAVVLNNLGSIESELKHLTEAFKYYKQSCDLEEKDGGCHYKDLAITYNSIGTFYYEQNNMDTARENFEKAFNILDNISTDHRDIAAVLYNNLAFVLNRQGEHEEALKYNEQCLNIRMHIFPHSHPVMAITLNSIASTLYYLKSFSQAVAYAKKAVDIDTMGLPHNHPQMKIHQENLDIFQNTLSALKQ